MERQYFTINESAARLANDMNSMRDYAAGSATAEYRKAVNDVYDIVDKIADQKPHLSEKAERMAARYSRKLAEYYNAYYRNEASCPSMLISGGGNFPTRKKERQNSRRDSLYSEWKYLEDYAVTIRHLLTMVQPILSSDAQAIELLEEKLEGLKEKQESMKQINRAVRMKDTAKGDDALLDMGYTEDQIRKFRKPDYCGIIGFPSWMLANNNANIRRIESRIKDLKAAKERGTSETEFDTFKAVENTDVMRYQIIFDGKPDVSIRNILKSNGFKWAPSQGAWQRQITGNGRWAYERVIEALKKLESEEA